MAFDGRCRALLPKVSRFAVTSADPLDAICTGNRERGINNPGVHDSEPCLPRWGFISRMSRR